MEISLFPNLLGLAVAVALCVLVLIPYSKTLTDTRLRRLLWIGFATRVVGSCGMFVVIVYVYGGGDAMGYVERAQAFRDALINSNVAFYFEPLNWWGDQWWGAQMVVTLCSFTALPFGPLLLPQFLLFSMAGFLGIWYMLLSFRSAYPKADWYRLSLLVICLPSVFFWSSNVGKEAIIQLGAGLAFGGLARMRHTRDVVWLATGLLLIFMIRPQVATVAGATIAFGYLAARWKTLKPQTIVFAPLLLAGAVFLTVRSAESLGLDSASVEAAQDYMEERNNATDLGTTYVEKPGTGLAGVPGGMANIFFRPFPWQIRNFTSMIASLEMVFLWGIVLMRAGRTLRYLKPLLQTPLFLAGAAFVVTYAALLGMVVFNMGIITRQRTVILPLILVLVHFVPTPRQARDVRRRVREPQLVKSEFLEHSP